MSSELPQPDATSPVNAAVDTTIGGLQRPHWLHPMSPLFDFLSHLRSMLVPIALAIVGAAREEVFWLIIGGVFVVLGLIFQSIHFFTFRYWLTDTDFVSRQGLIFHRTRTIPLAKIQNIDIVQNVLHRLFGVAECRIETASGKEVEAVLRVLSVTQFEALREAVTARLERFPGGSRKPAIVSTELSESPLALETSADADSTEGTDRAADTPHRLWQISVRQLVAAGLTNNRGLVIVGVILGAAYQMDLFNSAIAKRLWQLLPPANDWVTSAGQWLTLFLVLAIMLRVLSVIWFVTRFYGYELHRSGEGFQVSCGLLTRIKSTIPRRRIQVVSIQQNWLMRYFGHAVIRVETAGGAEESDSGSSGSLTRKWFIPVMPRGQAVAIVNALRPDIDLDLDGLTWHSPSPHTKARLMRLAGIKSVILMAVLAFLCWQWGTWWPMAAMALLAPLLFVWANKKSRSLYYARTEWGVVFRSGILNRKTSITFFDRIQNVNWHESPFDRRWRMANLTIDTSGAGPAEHEFDIPYLDVDLAHAEFERIRQQTAAKRLVWA